MRAGERLFEGGAAAPELRGYAATLLSDYLFSFQELDTDKGRRALVRSGASLDEYVRVQAPAVEWVVRAAGTSAPSEAFTGVLHKYNAHCKHAMVLRAIVRAFDGAHYASKAGAMVALAKQATEGGGVPLVLLLDALGAKFVANPPPEAQRLGVLNEVWRQVSRCGVALLPQYVVCASTWLDVLLRHYSGQEVVVLLADLAAHMTAAQVSARRSPPAVS